MGLLSFTPDDIELFSGASRDRNPLHVSPEYAHTTPFGEPVVFGILAALAVLGRARDRHRKILHRVDLEFRQPLHVAIGYRVEIDETDADQTVAQLMDAGRLMMTARFWFREGVGRSDPLPSVEIAARAEAADLGPAELRTRASARGMYAPAHAEFEKLIERFHLLAKGATRSQLAALVWSSYLVGMELPGRRALFWRLAMEFDPQGDECTPPFSYEARVKAYSEQMGVVETEAELACEAGPAVNARIRSFLRHDPPVPSAAEVAEILEPSERLRNRVALVVGGSRGLGASICQALAQQGCTVLLNYLRSDEEAKAVRTSVHNATGRIELLRGDVTDAAWCEATRAQLLASGDGLDFLICSATPSIRPLGFGLESTKRLQDFVAASTSMVSVPLAAFLDLVARRSGWSVTISSSAVVTLDPEWPHYVMAKWAAEGLVHWAAARYEGVRFLIARPPKLLTVQMNTPMGRAGAIGPEIVAAAIVDRISDSSPLAAAVECMEEFRPLSTASSGT